jgi:hypothetical protein
MCLCAMCRYYIQHCFLFCIFVRTRYARQGTRRARALQRAPGSAGWRAIGLSRGAISRRRSRHARAHVERSGQAHELLVNMSTRDAPAGLVWHCAAVLSCWDPCVTHMEPRSPPRLHCGKGGEDGAVVSTCMPPRATQPAAPPPCRQHTLLAPSRPPTAAQLVRAQATLPPTGPDLAPGFHRRERPQLAASIELSLSRSDGSAVLICPRRCA